MSTEKTHLQLAIKALTWMRRQHAAGHAAFLQGIDFTFAQTGHKHYLQITKTIQYFEDLLEANQEQPHVTRDKTRQRGHRKNQKTNPVRANQG